MCVKFVCVCGREKLSPRFLTQVCAHIFLCALGIHAEERGTLRTSLSSPGQTISKLYVCGVECVWCVCAPLLSDKDTRAAFTHPHTRIFASISRAVGRNTQHNEHRRRRRLRLIDVISLLLYMRTCRLVPVEMLCSPVQTHTYTHVRTHELESLSFDGGANFGAQRKLRSRDDESYVRYPIRANFNETQKVGQVATTTTTTHQSQRVGLLGIAYIAR